MQVGVNLGEDGDYMEKIISATKDLRISLVFNNAGFLTAGLNHAAGTEEAMEREKKGARKTSVVLEQCCNARLLTPFFFPE